MVTVDNPQISPPSGVGEDPKEKGFFNRPRKGGKSWWDWLNLLSILAIPLVVGVATIVFGLQQANLAQEQHDSDQKIAQQQYDADKLSALDQQRATILQTYIDNIQDLLLNHNLLKSQSGDAVAILARARTLTALHGLDQERKGVLLNFLYKAHLIGYSDVNHKLLPSIIDLFKADLSNADLTNAILVGARLYSANLRNANLTNADLTSANLTDADLSNADLTSAKLSETDLHCVLNGLQQFCTDLSGAKVTQKQLDQVYSCAGAALPQKLTCHRTP